MGRVLFKILSRQRIRLHQLLRRAGKQHLAAQPSRLRTYIYHIICLAHHLLVVLHHNHRVPHVAQLFQRPNQPLVVPLMKPDARLVKDIQHIHQPRPYLRRKAYALALPARQTVRRAVQRQVTQPHALHKLQPLAYLFHYRLCHRQLRRGQSFQGESIALDHPHQLVDIHLRQVGDAVACYLVTQRLLVQPLPMAYRALCPLLLALLRGRNILLCATRRVRQCHQFLIPVRIVHHILQHLIRQPSLCHASLFQSYPPQSLAARAPTLRAVKRERMRRRVGIRKPRRGAHQVTRQIAHLLAPVLTHHHHPIALRHRLIHRLPQPHHILRLSLALNS